MKYKTPEAFRTPLGQRLKNEAESTGVALMRLRKRVTFALELRLGLHARTTKDIDLARNDDEKAATEHLNAASGIDLGDFFDFEARRTPALDGAAGFRAVRYTIRADLAGRRFEQFPVDVALSESSSSQAEALLVSSSLEFAEVEAIKLPVVGLEQHVAEKLHAYTGTYGPDGRASTRVKDLVDLVLISEFAELDAERLSHVLATIFAQRASQPLPNTVPPPPSSWARPYAELAQEVGIATEIDAGHAAAADLLDPVLGLVSKGQWDPNARDWRLRK